MVHSGFENIESKNHRVGQEVVAEERNSAARCSLTIVAASDSVDSSVAECRIVGGEVIEGAVTGLADLD